MDETKIRQIVQEEIKRNNNRSPFGLQNTSNHAHTGNDGTPRIKQADVIPNVSVSGRITMSSEAIYTININAAATPNSIFCTGNVTGDSGEAYMFVGTAQLGPSFYLQPDDNRSVTVGGPQYPFSDPNHPEYGSNIPMQSCSYFGSESNTGAGRHTLVGNFHIIDIQYPSGTTHARATIIDFSRTSITVAVESLDAGWTINANFVIV